MEKVTLDKQNKKRLFWLIAVPVFLGLAAVFFRYLHAFSCPFRTYCHFLCVGCGITRAFGALLKGQILSSVMYNPLAILLSVVGILYYSEQWCRFFGKKVTLIVRNRALWLVVTAVYILYCILRNIPALSCITWA